MLEYKPKEELIALVQRQEAEIAAEHEENNKLKAALTQAQSTIGRMTLELAAARQVADGYLEKAAAQPVAGELPPLDGNVVPAEWLSEPCGASVDHLSYGYGFKRGFNHCREEVLDRIAAQPVQQPAAVGEFLGYISASTHERMRKNSAAHSVCPAIMPNESDLPGDAIPVYTAPVPAAGVQGDAVYSAIMEKALSPTGYRTYLNGDPLAVHPDVLNSIVRYTVATTVQPDSGRDACPNCKGAGHRHEASGEKLPCDLCGDEDSGRDAALWTCRKMNDLGSIYDSNGELVANTYYQCANGITEAHNAAIRALAAHPAPSSDAAKAYYLTPNQVRIICEGLDLFESDTSSIQDNATSERLQAYFAAHPANGAQAGDEGYDEGLIWSLRDDAAKLKELNPDDEMAETMIEAADRIEGFAAAPQTKKG